MANEWPVDIGPQYEGDTVRKEDLYAEWGGPKVKHKFELVTLKDPEEIEHEKVELIGIDIKDMEEGGSYPLAMLIDIAGETLEKDMEPVIERRQHMYFGYIEGPYHMNQRDEIWIRLSKSSFKKGLNSFKQIGEMLIFLYTSELDPIEKMQMTFITDEEKIKELLPHAREVYAARDARLIGMKEEDVDEFYACVLCQSFAPTHCCTITPERIANCGAISWLDGKAAYKLDPEGPIFAVPKGEIIDPIRGEYTGVNEYVKKSSLGEFDRQFLHSAFEQPHTSCGCFQSICFYIPEADGFGIVHRDYVGETVIGMKFSTMAGETSGGKQVEGFLGMALDYLKSPKFLQADGGLHRIVWIGKEIKERFKDVLEAKGLYDKIASEEDVKNTDELMEFLDKAGHPWIKGEVKLPE